MSHTHWKRESTTMPPRREKPSIDAAIIGTDPKVEAELSPVTTPLPRERLTRLKYVRE
jgi:hypothetical protein